MRVMKTCQVLLWVSLAVTVLSVEGTVTINLFEDECAEQRLDNGDVFIGSGLEFPTNSGNERVIGKISSPV